MKDLQMKHVVIQQDWIEFACKLADIARAMLLAGHDSHATATLKPDRSFVTALDSAIEARLRAEIVKTYPDHGIIGEEDEPSKTGSDYTWILDPIDGTAPFIAGVPVYGTLIAFAIKGRPVIGIIDLPVTSQRWLGVVGQPSRLNGEVIHTRACPDLAMAIVSASNPDFFTAAEAPALEALKAKSAWRIYGGCCMSYGLLACGRTDVAIDTRLQIYDYAAFVPIIEGAGGVITDWQGQPLTLSSGPQVLAAGHAERHAEALALVQKALAV
jgi:inositol-phosphate phosphatase/L-galactose 1-phosphate phosphatase/histidinol-phosphatase